MLRNTGLITQNVDRLTDFYFQALGMPAKWSGADYVDAFRTMALVGVCFGLRFPTADETELGWGYKEAMDDAKGPTKLSPVHA